MKPEQIESIITTIMRDERTVDGKVSDMLRAAILRAIEIAREECAEIAESVMGSPYHSITSREAGRRIRARGMK